MAAPSSVVFAINGERHELADGELDPGTTLLEYLRTRTRFTGAKLGCGEGGCGACVVLLSTYDPATGRVRDSAVSSCLTLLYSINFCSVTTTEGLGNCRDGFHSVHQRLAGFHASQCGFCTPGMSMSLFSALVNADKSDRPDPPEGFSKIRVCEAEKAIAGNLCRCTGYRPIVDACKSFAEDVDLEDLGLNSFWKNGSEVPDVNKLPCYTRGGVCTFPEFLKSDIMCHLADKSMVECASLPGGNMYHPQSLEELYQLIGYNGVPRNVKLFSGNTGSGIYRDLNEHEQFIDLRGIPELNYARRDAEGLEVGAALTISQVIELLREENSDQSIVFHKIADHMEKVASHFVRNMASLGGNIVMSQRDKLPSDIATILLAAGCSVSVHVSSEKQVMFSLEEFLERPSDDGYLLLTIRIPSWNFNNIPLGNGIGDSEAKKPRVMFETYRAAPRSLGNAVAYLNSAFLAEVSPNKKTGDIVLCNLRLAFGAFGNRHAIRATKVEGILLGKPITASVVLEACRELKALVYKEGTHHPAYQSSLAVAFLFKFLHPVASDFPVPESISHVNGLSNVDRLVCMRNCDNGNFSSSDNKARTRMRPGLHEGAHMLLSSKQAIQYKTDYQPVGKPIKKDGAELQASGEAIYVDDIPAPKDCVYGAFLYSTKPLAHVKSISLGSTTGNHRAIDLINIKDIPKGGANVGAASIFGAEPLFADSLTEFAGQPLGIAIAQTQRSANIAAKHAVVEYSTDNLEPPILSIEKAVEKSSFFEVPPFLYPKSVGKFSSGMAEADHTILSAEVDLESQYYFYMETQTALAIPDEDNCVTVYSSTQTPETVQSIIAKCLGLPFHNVRVITRRVGGGFGGKAIRSFQVATACALAAFKLRRPVRMYLDRKTDIIMTGGRHPMKICYSVGFKSDGKVTALHIDLYVNAGFTMDVSPIIPHNFISALKKYNWGNFSFNAMVCKTNIMTKSAMRGPGEVQGSYVAEAIIEHIASVLSVESCLIRKRNLHTSESIALFHEDCADESSEYTLPAIVDKMTTSTSQQMRIEMIRSFNKNNRWRKRGISWVPVVHKVMLMPTPGKVSILGDGSIVVEVGGIELGQGLWTKVKQMAAFGLGKLWSDGSQDLLERIRVIQADTLTLVQGGWTTGSTTSESSCQAVRLACDVLVDRLKSLKEGLQQSDSIVSWDSLICQAVRESVNLSASALSVPNSASSYLNYGAATSEVEVDLLTGATTILQSDLVYDCGQSLNPAVDLGQIEGAFVQGIGYFMCEDYQTNSDGLVVSDGTWTYKIPTVDTIPQKFNVELLNSGFHKNRVLSSKASGEPPLLLAASVHCATREAIRAARMEFSRCFGSSVSTFDLKVPATMPVVKELCGLDNVEKYLEELLASK